MLYNVGDRVVIRDDLTEYDGSNMYYMLKITSPGVIRKDNGQSNTVTRSMYALRGKVFAITGISRGQYILEDANVGPCRWTDEMFAGLEKDVSDGDIQKSKTSIADFLSPS